MLAGHISAPCKIELIQVPEQHLSSDVRGEILFQPELACLCGSDIPYFEHAEEVEHLEVGHSLHEMIGSVVETTGERFQPGDRVLAVPVEHLGLFEHFPLCETRAIPLDPRIPPEQALMAQPLGTVLFALKKIPQILDQDVVVVGQGPMGQLFNMALRNMGARQIIGIDKLESRLAVSQQTGATSTLCNQTDDPSQAVLDLTGGRGADLVIEVVGHRDQALNLCISLARVNGDILFFGVPSQTMDNFQIRPLFWKNLTLYTSVMPDFRYDFPLAMRWIAEGRVDVTPLLTHRFPLTDIQTAFEVFHQRVDGAIKVLIDFPAGQGNT